VVDENGFLRQDDGGVDVDGEGLTEGVLHLVDHVCAWRDFRRVLVVLGLGRVFDTRLTPSPPPGGAQIVLSSSALSNRLPSFDEQFTIIVEDTTLIDR
jgi:hypothetical protein